MLRNMHNEPGVMCITGAARLDIKESKQQEKWKEMLNRPSTTYLDKKIAVLLKLHLYRPGHKEFCVTCLKDTIVVGLILMVF